MPQTADIWIGLKQVWTGEGAKAACQLSSFGLARMVGEEGSNCRVLGGKSMIVYSSALEHTTFIDVLLINKQVSTVN